MPRLSLFLFHEEKNDQTDLDETYCLCYKWEVREGYNRHDITIIWQNGGRFNTWILYAFISELLLIYCYIQFCCLYSTSKKKILIKQIRPCVLDFCARQKMARWFAYDAGWEHFYLEWAVEN